MAKLAPLTFRIAKLWGAPQGTVENHDIDQKISYPGENLDFATNFVAKLMLIRLKEELCAIISDATISINMVCPLCLKAFVQAIKIESAEREFLHDAPKKVEDPSDLYLINKKMMTIDLAEMVRQEIILHFPLVSVCSKSCKGLCMHCGADCNKKKCACKAGDSETHQPFKDLRRIMNN